MLIRIRVTRCDTLLISHSPLSKSTFVTSPKITSLSIFTTGTYTLPSNQTSTRSPQPISTITSESSLCELKYFSIVSSHVSYRSKSLVPSPSKPSHSSSLNMRTLGRLLILNEIYFMFSTKLSQRILVSTVSKRWKTVFVGLSGGIDSSVSAYLLLKQGYDVKGVFMKNWSAEEETGKPLCPLKDDFIDARNVAEFLGIPLITYDFEKEYWTNVFEVCLDAFSSGLTPNPDVLCNRYIKFDAFAHRCFHEGADYIATGHYCRTNQGKPLSPFSEGIELLRGIDKSKDQSYFLSQINHSLLSRVLFPVGGMTKTAVRRLAEEVGLPNARKEESMGICFIGERNMKSFLNEYLSASPGKIRTIDGREIGKHDGILFFTIGQGVKIPNQREKYYVCQKNAQTNELIVCPGNHPALFRHDFYVAQSLQMHARSTGTMRCGRALPLFHFSLRIAQHTPIPSPFNANYATKQFANLVISSHL
ncbi:uncharacterized protein [Blastocystis hominis]|uniref:tRNA-5-taurinomethyluridine 2-sulfurtransferase n=1 Tax=Blastocystis hominis TaxID=12968 RepID=D8M0H6_BLAHO|nr:uncharacterized protein [Blastocystis hominis]CBK21565.2 unnamed protein product [Blastocystis hominis]|eukprot:XP_012895613.1 uncharacterized protein [Blastocystis hominis]